MAIEVFNRYEKKYIINDEMYEDLLSVIDEHMERDMYNLGGKPYVISNLYYDDDTDYVIRRSVEKPSYKEKLRLRSYGVTPLDGRVYLEIKKKFNGLVNKRRTRLTLQEAYDFIETGNPPELKDYMNKQVLKELTYYLSRHKVHPVAYVRYERFAFFEKGNIDLRVSFDRNIITRRYDLNLHTNEDGELLLPEGLWILEIKTGRAIPVWLAKALSENGIYRRSFSKIGTDYLKNVERRMGGQQKCINSYSVEGLKQHYLSRML